MVGIGMCRREPSEQVHAPVPSDSSTSWTTLSRIRERSGRLLVRSFRRQMSMPMERRKLDFCVV